MLTSGWVWDRRGRSSEERKELKSRIVRKQYERRLRDGGLVLHSARAAVPVAVVDVEAFTLEDECADAVLWGWISW